MTSAKIQVDVPATLLEKQEWLKKVQRDTRLTHQAKRVSTILFLCHNTTSGQCNPSQDYLAKATDLWRTEVVSALKLLRNGGWIDRTRTGGASRYRLNVAIAAAEGDAEMSGQPDNAMSGPPDKGMSGLPDNTMSGPPGYEQRSGTGKRTGNLNRRPAGVVRTPEIEGSAGPSGEPKPASIQTAPTAQRTKPPEPANDDVRRGFVEIAGLKIPEGTHAQWVAAFTDINLMASILKRARWALRLPEDRRMNALQTELGKLNDEARQAQLDRKAHEEAKAAAPPPKPPRSRYAI